MSIGAIYGHLAVNGYRDNETMAYALTTSFINTAIALAIGYVFYRLIKTKGTPIKASEHGRNWTAWLVVISTTALLPKVIMQPNINTVFAWLVPLIVFSAITFILGFVYGKFKVRKDSSTGVADNPNTTSNNKTINSGVNCSNCGAEIKPKGAKFCGRCGAKFEPPKISNANTDSGTQTKTVSQNISSSPISKAEAVRPPTIEKKIVAEAEPEKSPSEKQEKKVEKTAVYINEKRSNGNKHNQEGLIFLSIFAIIFIVVLSKSGKVKTDVKDEITYYGTFAYDNGDIYEGQLKDGRPTFKKGYQLKYKYSKIHQEVRRIRPNSNSLPTDNNQPLRIPDLKYNNGKTKEYYERNGYTWVELDYYIGWTKNNSYNGYGLITFNNNAGMYEGEILNGKKHGKGILTLENGDIFEGEFKNDWAFCYGQLLDLHNLSPQFRPRLEGKILSCERH